MLAICCVSMVVVVMDISVVNVALPAMGRALRASESGLQWTGGGLVDAFGWRSVFWVNVPGRGRGDRVRRAVRA